MGRGAKALPVPAAAGVGLLDDDVERWRLCRPLAALPVLEEPKSGGFDVEGLSPLGDSNDVKRDCAMPVLIMEVAAAVGRLGGEDC